MIYLDHADHASSFHVWQKGIVDVERGFVLLTKQLAIDTRHMDFDKFLGTPAILRYQQNCSQSEFVHSSHFLPQTK